MRDVIEAVGLLVLVVGLGMMWLPFGVVALGCALILAANLGDRS